VVLRRQPASKHVVNLVAFKAADPASADGRDELLLDGPGEAVDGALAFDLPAVQAVFEPAAEHVGDGLQRAADGRAFLDLAEGLVELVPGLGLLLSGDLDAPAAVLGSRVGPSALYRSPGTTTAARPPPMLVTRPYRTAARKPRTVPHRPASLPELPATVRTAPPPDRPDLDRKGSDRNRSRDRV